MTSQTADARRKWRHTVARTIRVSACHFINSSCSTLAPICQRRFLIFAAVQLQLLLLLLLMAVGGERRWINDDDRTAAAPFQLGDVTVKATPIRPCRYCCCRHVGAFRDVQSCPNWLRQLTWSCFHVATSRIVLSRRRGKVFLRVRHILPRDAYVTRRYCVETAGAIIEGPHFSNTKHSTWWNYDWAKIRPTDAVWEKCGFDQRTRYTASHYTPLTNKR